jgi:hypothetical protein
MKGAFGTTVTPVTVGALEAMVRVALPQTAGTRTEQAMIATEPEPEAAVVTTPVCALIEAFDGSLVLHVTARLVTPASAFTAALNGIVTPLPTVTPFGATLMLRTVGSGSFTVTSSPHAATPATSKPDHSIDR